jgi:hypothetical protein
MDNLQLFAEPSATRFVREITGQIELRDTDDDALYLGPAWTKQDCYMCNCDIQGYKLETSSTGKTTLIPVALDDEERKPCITWSTFLAFWKKEYPKLRVSKPAKDICGQCYIFCNQHKFCSHLNVDDDRRNKDYDDDSDDNNNGNNDGRGGNDDGSGVNDGGSKDKDMTEEEMRNLTSVMDAENDRTHQEENMLKAADHVKAAKAQRQLFNTKIVDAREDTKNNIPHHSRRHCLVVDYCPLTMLPYFGGVQPGKTYYYLPLNYNTLGCVDPSKKGGNCLYAHLYHKGQGKKGGNNVLHLL